MFCSIRRTVVPCFWISWMISKFLDKDQGKSIDGSSKRRESLGVTWNRPQPASAVHHLKELPHLGFTFFQTGNVKKTFQVGLIFFDSSLKAPFLSFPITVKPGNMASFRNLWKATCYNFFELATFEFLFLKTQFTSTWTNQTWKNEEWLFTSTISTYQGNNFTFINLETYITNCLDHTVIHRGFQLLT